MSNRELIAKLKGRVLLENSATSDVDDLMAEAAAALEAHEWKPIESAPKGSLLLIEDGIRFIGFWDDRKLIFTDIGNNDSANPTHWMPLPTPPTQGDSKQ